MIIDSERLRADTNALARECRALKDVLGTTWTRPMADEQRKLVRLRWRVTELCVLRAWSRQRVHVKTAPQNSPLDWDCAAWHSKIAERVAKDYACADANANANANANASASASAEGAS
jgi:hypothetical protein